MSTRKVFLIALAHISMLFSPLKNWGGDETQVAKAEEPITICVSSTPGFSNKCKWYMSVNSAGSAELTIATPDRFVRREFKIHPTKLDELHKAVIESEYFDLQRAVLGVDLIDGASDSITVIRGTKAKTVDVRRFGSRNIAPDELRDVKNVLNILSKMRALFDDESAADCRKFEAWINKI